MCAAVTDAGPYGHLSVTLVNASCPLSCRTIRLIMQWCLPCRRQHGGRLASASGLKAGAANCQLKTASNAIETMRRMKLRKVYSLYRFDLVPAVTWPHTMPAGLCLLQHEDMLLRARLPERLGPLALLPLEDVDGLGEVGDADVAGQRRVLALELQEHLPGHAAVAEVAGGGAAEFGDVLGFGEVHFEEGADARGERVQVGGGLDSLGRPPRRRGDLGRGLVSGFDGGTVIGEDARVGKDFSAGGQVAGAGGFVAVLRREALDDLGAAAMAVQVAEAANVHEEVEAESGAGLEGA